MAADIRCLRVCRGENPLWYGSEGAPIYPQTCPDHVFWPREGTRETCWRFLYQSIANEAAGTPQSSISDICAPATLTDPARRELNLGCNVTPLWPEYNSELISIVWLTIIHTVKQSCQMYCRRASLVWQDGSTALFLSALRSNYLVFWSRFFSEVTVD